MEAKLTQQQISYYYNHLAYLVCYDRAVEIDAFLQKNPDACQMLMTPVQHGGFSISLLMCAAFKGALAAVRLFLERSSVGKNQIEQGGSVSTEGGRLIENITPLWLALHRRHYHVAQTLIHLGNARVDRGPKGHLLYEAICNGRLPTVRFLIENGYADVNGTPSTTEYKDHTLYLAVSRGDTQLVDYLLSRNVHLNEQSTSTKDTALHAAVLKGSLWITQSLCSAGAMTNIINARGATPLMIAAEKLNRPIINMLLDDNHDQKAFDDIELVASSALACGNGPLALRIDSMKSLLHLSLNKRILFGQSKSILPPTLAFDHQQECQTIEEFEQIQNDEDRLFTEALLIQERILRVRSSRTLSKPLLKRFYQLITRVEFNRALNILFHFFDLQQTLKIRMRPTVFIWVFCKMIIAAVLVPVEQFLNVCDSALESLSLLRAKDDLIMDLLHLVGLGSKILEQTTTTDQQRHSIIQWIKAICHKQPCTTAGRTLLHLSVTNESYGYHVSYARAIHNVIKFPNVNVTRLLLSYSSRWINVNATDQLYGNTALHLIAQNSLMFSNDEENIRITELLINAGAHTDCVNNSGRRPFDLTSNEAIQTLIRSKEGCPRLKCLCANLIGECKIDYNHIWPASTAMNQFLHLHRGTKRKRSVLDDDDDEFRFGDTEVIEYD